MKRQILSHHFHEITSTMDEGDVILRDNQFHANELAVITADIQTAGRGREGRPWSSIKGNLHSSFCFKLPSYHASTIYQLSFVSAVGVNRVFSSLISPTLIQNKWPNDILIEQKKCAGILVETFPEVQGVIIGIGANIQEKPSNVIYPTTFLHKYTANVTPADLSIKIANQLNTLIDQWENNEFSMILSEWKNKMWGLNENITIKTRISTLHGLLYNIDDQGFLLVKQPNGHIHRLTAGDVIF